MLRIRWSHSEGMTERGATLVEAAIILPFVLAFLFTIIDFSRVITRRIIISNSLRVAARYAALQPNHCDVAARTKLTEELTRFGILDSSLDVHTVRDETLPSSTAPVFVLRVTANAQVSCILCPIFQHGLVYLNGDFGQFNFHSEAVVPIEREGACQ